MFGANSVALSLFEISGENSEILYQVAYDIDLDDGSGSESESPEDEKHITIFTDIVDSDKISAIETALPGLVEAFAGVLNTVFVFDTQGDIIEEIDLDQVFSEIITDQTTSNKQLH